MTPTFYWHDYETWGATPSVDRPVQFAGVRTDMDLNIVGDPLMIFSRPSPDFLPHPEACLITGITPQQALEEGVCEAEFIAAVHRELGRPGTCGVGYNSIRFDDEVTRYTLYRNFYDPYAREWQNGNSRWDLIDVARLCAALRPEGINWPKREDGSPSYKLETLCAANGLSHESAHDALSDVYATIELAKLLKQRQPRLFHYALSLRDKKMVAGLLDVQTQVPLLHVSGKFSASRYCSALVMPIAPHPSNKNSVIVYDLSVDPQPLMDLSPKDIMQRVFSSAEDLPEGQTRIPLKEVHINRSPIVATARLLDEKNSPRLGIDLDQCRQHWKMLRRTEGLLQKVQKVYEKREFPVSDDPDTALYAGFFSAQDRKQMEFLRRESPEALATKNVAFQDPRLPELLWRYRARNFPETLSAEELHQWREFCSQRLRKPGPQTLGFESFRRRLFELSEQGLSDHKRHILEELNDYAAALEQEGL